MATKTNTCKTFFFAVLLICGLFLFSCRQQQEQPLPNTFAPKVVETKGYTVPIGSVIKPKAIPAGKPNIIKVGKPKVVLTNTNVFPLGKAKIILEGKQRVIFPGQDTFSIPKIVPAIDSPFVAGLPEVKAAKEPHINDNNSQFSLIWQTPGLEKRCNKKFAEG